MDEVFQLAIKDQLDFLDNLYKSLDGCWLLIDARDSEKGKVDMDDVLRLIRENRQSLSYLVRLSESFQILDQTELN